MRLTAGLLWALALALTGCGGESPSPADRYRADANAICDRAETEVEAVIAGRGDPERRERRVRAILARAFDRLTALRSPPELAAAHARLG